MRETTIIHVTQSVSRLGGGLFESVRHLSQTVQEHSHADISVLGLRDSYSDVDTAAWAPVAVRSHKVIGTPAFGYAPSMYIDLLQAGPELVHLHGLWKYPSIAAYRWARRTGRPYIVSPHGMLEPWALTQSRFKKWLATLLYQGPCLRNAAFLRATSQMEAESIRLAGYRAPLVLVPNGIEFPPKPLPPDSRPPGHPRRMLFLSRIHPKKGLLNLVQAWNLARPKGWELLLVGPDEKDHKSELQAAVEGCGLRHQIFFPGPAWGASRTQMYRDSDVFVLPTFSENFGLVIAEALSCEIPVITTRGTPWEDLNTHKCGWWIDIGVEPLVEALKEAFSTSSDVLHEMGIRGRLLVEEKYAWGPIGRVMADVYRWMLGRGPKPECVLDD
jgi:glycosyltransferase involved in cell wall biosynthesis